MKTFIASILLAASADALVARTSSCCFQLTAKGGPGGQVGQLSDGQNRIGQNLPPATYCIDDGAITDGSGRGCILTSPSTQFQCDSGATPQGGFDVGCDGTVTYSGSSTFYSCPTGDNGGYNIYTTPVAGQDACVTITLSANGCYNCPATTTTTATPTTTPTPTPTPKVCPANLSGNYQFPHLIVPVDSSKPNTAVGTSYNGEITPTVSSIFNFDIPSSYAGQTCSLVFLLPESSQLQTSSYTLSGSGQIDFSLLNGVATSSTDYANAPGVAQDYGVTTVAAGNSYTIATFACQAGQTVAYELESEGGTSLTYFQDYNPSPIGLYITSC